MAPTGIRTQRGFTLIELMIAVAIGGILLALAAPSYKQYMIKSRRGDAISALNTIVQAQERYRSGNAGYASTVAGLFPSGMQSVTHYSIQLSGVTATAFTVTATPLSGSPQSSDDECATISIAVSGGVANYAATTSTGSASTNCWPK